MFVDFQDPYAVAVLLQNDFVMVDLTSPKYDTLATLTVLVCIVLFIGLMCDHVVLYFTNIPRLSIWNIPELKVCGWLVTN